MSKFQWRTAAVAAIAATVLGACTTTGVGSGDVVKTGAPVQFTWKSLDGGLTGTMTATVPDNGVFTGKFVQISSTTEIESLGPLWGGWAPGWNDWPYWGPGPDVYNAAQFVTRYSGKVLVNLQNGPGTRMRCRLLLTFPSQGMSGGGDGECQINGATIAARF